MSIEDHPMAGLDALVGVEVMSRSEGGRKLIDEGLARRALGIAGVLRRRSDGLMRLKRVSRHRKSERTCC
jgi:hypothetical protein